MAKETSPIKIIHAAAPDSIVCLSKDVGFELEFVDMGITILMAAPFQFAFLIRSVRGNRYGTDGHGISPRQFPRR